jgi:16S rRNA (uracil1498-N3)-methyltransferase
LRITRIYYPGSISSGETLTLPANASHHLIRVLRYKKSTSVALFNGQGGEYKAFLLNEDPKAARLNIQHYVEINRESPLKTILAQGVSRNEHMDATIQKATELGVSEIIPVICERSATIKKERMNKKLDRWNQIVISACEQSGRNILPVLHDISTFDQALKHVSTVTRLVMDPTAAQGIRTIEQHTGPISVLCGPEGGLSETEIDTACKAGYKRTRFGPRVLRTETAGPASISALQVLWGDMG